MEVLVKHASLPTPTLRAGARYPPLVVGSRACLCAMIQGMHFYAAQLVAHVSPYGPSITVPLFTGFAAVLT